MAERRGQLVVVGAQVGAERSPDTEDDGIDARDHRPGVPSHGEPTGRHGLMEEFLGSGLVEGHLPQLDGGPAALVGLQSDDMKAGSGEGDAEGQPHPAHADDPDGGRAISDPFDERHGLWVRGAVATARVPAVERDRSASISHRP